MMISSASELGWGWKSVTKVAKKVGSGAKRVSTGAVSVSKSAAGRVAAAAASTLCNPDGSPKSNDASTVNYCRAVKLKRTASVSKYAPSYAVTAAQKAQAVRAAYNAPAQAAQPVQAAPSPQFAPPPVAPPRAANVATDVETSEDLAGAFGTPLSRALMQSRQLQACARRRMLAQRIPYAGARLLCMRRARAGLQGGDPDVNLLTSLAGTLPLDGARTANDIVAASPALLAVAIGAYLFRRK